MARSKPIFVPGTSQVYVSAAAAAKALGIDAGNISKVLRGKRKTAGGYSFGYATNRTVYIPETGRTFDTIQAAARSVKVNTSKVEHILENNVSKSVGGYHFEYADLSKIPIGRSSVAAKKNRKAKKQARQKDRRKKKQEQYAALQKRDKERAAERSASSARQARKQKERIDQIRAKYAAYLQAQKQMSLSKEVKELQALLERINAQLQKYQDANMMGYSRIAQDVEEFQNYLGFTDDGMFDVSEENMSNIMQELSAEEITHWTNQLTDMTDRKNGLFWNLKKQIQERAKYAIEFGVSPEEMDVYVDLLPELWKIFEQARHYSMYEKVGQYMWTEIKNSVKSGISPQDLRQVMNELKKWDGSSSKELQEILGDLEVFIHLESIFDDDDLPF